MINLFTTYFTHPKIDRHKEIEHVLQQNINNPIIDGIYLLNESDSPQNSKITTRSVSKRPTFRQFFDWANEITKPDDLSVICNSDIFFDTIGLIQLMDWMCKDDAIALTRWELSPDGMARFNNDGCCQDTWAFCGPIKPIDCDFPMGYRGCDNKLAYEIRKAGYTLLNPSKMVRSYHYHLSGVRDWNWTNELFVDGPYNCVEVDPHE
jgi:hypothetical protein